MKENSNQLPRLLVFTIRISIPAGSGCGILAGNGNQIRIDSNRLCLMITNLFVNGVQRFLPRQAARVARLCSFQPRGELRLNFVTTGDEWEAGIREELSESYLEVFESTCFII